jgi:probable F420-dependent oxidoreductase
MAMRIGVTVPNVHETLAERTTIEAVGRMADELGFDSSWCNDHLAIPSAAGDGAAEPAYAAAYGEQRGQSIYEPLIVLAYLAAVTRRVLLGTSVYLLPLRHPLVAAGQAVSLDRLSDGRLVLGVGAGWLESEFAAVGVPYRQRGRRTDEAIAMLKSLCREDGAEFLPKPVQRPHPPLWIGGRSGAAVRRAARLGDAWHPSHLTVDELRRQIPDLRAEEGLRLLLFFGDELQIPTTGVAVDPSVVALDDPRVEGLVRANLRALGTMLADPALGAEHVGRLLPTADDAAARDFYDRYVGSWFKADGLADAGVVAGALPLVAEELRIITGRAVHVPPPSRSTAPTSPPPGRRTARSE